METAEIVVSQAPYGGKITLRQGTLKVSQIEKPLQVQGGQTTVELLQVAAPVRVTNRGTVKVQIASKFPVSKQPLSFEIENGDLELNLPRDFEGTYYFWLTETNPKEAQASVRSALELSKAQVVETKSADQRHTMRETSYGGTFGKGGTPLEVHITNGRLIINRY